MDFNVQSWIDYTWLALVIIWIVSSAYAKPAARAQSGNSRLIHLILTIMAFVLLFDTRINLGPLNEPVIPASPTLDYLGFGLTMAGILFTIWARFCLGANWSASVTVKESHTLIRKGPYSVVRHPIYSGILLGALGTALAFGRMRCFVGVVLLTIGFRVKSLLEERFMQEQFGMQYTSYKHDVKALVPFIW